MKEELKNIFLMGLGAMSIQHEKAQELKKELLEKGQELYDKGIVANEELKHNIKESIKENVTIITANDIKTKDDIIAAMKNLSEEDKKEILESLNEK